MRKIILLFILLFPVWGSFAQYSEISDFEHNGYYEGSSAVIDIDIDGITDCISITGRESRLIEPFPIQGEELNINHSSAGSETLPVNGRDDSQSYIKRLTKDGEVGHIWMGSKESGSNLAIEVKKRTSDGTYIMIENHNILKERGVDGLIHGRVEVYDFISDTDNLSDIWLTGFTFSDPGNTSSTPIFYAALYKNNGDYTFSLFQETTGIFSAASTVGTFPGDSRPSIIYSGHAPGAKKEIILLKNNGNGFDEIRLSHLPAFSYGTLSFVDRDEDGFVDRLYGSGHGGTGSGGLVSFYQEIQGGESQFFSKSLSLSDEYRPLEASSSAPVNLGESGLGLVVMGQGVDGTSDLKIFKDSDNGLELYQSFPKGLNSGFISIVKRGVDKPDGILVNGKNNDVSWNQYAKTVYMLPSSEVLSTDDISLGDKWSIYPNPATDFLNIKGDFDIKKIEVFNSLSQKIIETKNREIYISDLAPGIYHIYIFDRNGQKTVKKIIKN